LAAIAAQFAVFEKGERAGVIAQNNPDQEEQFSALSQIAQVLTLQNKDDLARDTIDMIGDDSHKVGALIMMSDVKQRLGDSDAAMALLDEAVSWADTIPQLVARSSAMIDISSRYAEHGLTDRVRKLGLSNLENINVIRDESSQAVAVASLSEVYSKADLTIGDEEKPLIEKILAKF
jgi:hypothetical protein